MNNYQRSVSLSSSAADRFGRRVAARLESGSGELPYHVSERLRAAREQALQARRVVTPVIAPALQVQGSGGAASLSFGPEKTSLWTRLASALPIAALVAGLVAIQMVQSEQRARDLAEVETALLTDDLPPAAYTDPGFAQYLATEEHATQ